MSEPGLYQFLRNVPAVAAIVGDRIYPQMAPQHVYEEPGGTPFVVFTRAGGQRQQLFCGTDDLVQASYRIDARAPKLDDANELARAIRAALVDYSGAMGDVAVDTVQLSDDSDIGPDPEPGLFNRSESYAIWYREV